MDLFSRTRPEEPKALSVTQLLRRMKLLLEREIGEVWVEGEVSNLKKQGSGHWYFSLKDEGAQIQCAMFGARKRPGAEALADGAKVRVFAEAGVYEARGQLQLIVERVERAGLGELQARFEALKRQLQAEGLFDAARKRAIPPFPRVVGIVTSETGAAIRDMLQVMQRRAPWVQAVLFPVRVQGRGAAREIAQAIGRMGQPEAFGLPRCEVLIVGRGGGSLEDLWCFNEEEVARALAACPIPVISAVGHEIDFTIADFVADLRAPTPSAAAELAVPDGAELAARLALTRRRMERRVQERLQRIRLAVDGLKRGVLQRGGEKLLREPALRLDSLRAQLERAVQSSLTAAARQVREAAAAHRAQHPARIVERRFEHLSLVRRRQERAVREGERRRREQLRRLGELLRALGPGSAFERGFSIAMDERGRIVKSASQLLPGDRLRTKFADGEIGSRVTGQGPAGPAAETAADTPD